MSHPARTTFHHPRRWVTAVLAAILALVGLPTAIATAAEGGTLTVDRATVELGQPLEFAFTVDEPMDRNWIGIYPADRNPGEVDALHWQYTPETAGSRTWMGDAEGGWIVQGDIGPGDYMAHLLQNDGYVSLADPVRFTVTGDDTEPEIPAPLTPTGESSPGTSCTAA